MPRPRVRPSRAGLRPAATTARGLRRRADHDRGQGGSLGLAGQRPAEAPHHRRRPRRSRPRSRRSARRRHARALDRERRPPRRHEGGRRPLRLRRDAAAVRAAVRGDDEVGSRAPRAVHGALRRLDEQGPHRARDREGRCARHRQEPGRHHPHEQRLRGLQPRHQVPDRRHGRDRRGDQGGRDRDERVAREVDAHHARQLGGAERQRAVALPRAARRRRLDAVVRRTRSPRGVRRPALLRARRVRRPPHDGAPHGAEAHRRGGSGLRAGAHRTGAAGEAGLRGRHGTRAPPTVSTGRRPTTSSSCRPSSGPGS